MNNNSLRFKGFFSNMTPNKKSNTKLANDFFGTFIFPIHPEVRIIHEIVIFFCFLKISVLLYHPHLHQVFTILSLPSIHQSTVNNQFEPLMHQSFDFYSSYLITYAHKLHLFNFLSIFIKKTNILILNFVRFKLMILGH